MLVDVRFKSKPCCFDGRCAVEFLATQGIGSARDFTHPNSGCRSCRACCFFLVLTVKLWFQGTSNARFSYLSTTGIWVLRMLTCQLLLLLCGCRNPSFQLYTQARTSPIAFQLRFSRLIFVFRQLHQLDGMLQNNCSCVSSTWSSKVESQRL